MHGTIKIPNFIFKEQSLRNLLSMKIFVMLIDQSSIY